MSWSKLITSLNELQKTSDTLRLNATQVYATLTREDVQKVIQSLSLNDRIVLRECIAAFKVISEVSVQVLPNKLTLPSALSVSTPEGIEKIEEISERLSKEDIDEILVQLEFEVDTPQFNKLIEACNIISSYQTKLQDTFKNNPVLKKILNEIKLPGYLTIEDLTINPVQYFARLPLLTKDFIKIYNQTSAENGETATSEDLLKRLLSHFEKYASISDKELSLNEYQTKTLALARKISPLLKSLYLNVAEKMVNDEGKSFQGIGCLKPRLRNYNGKEIINSQMLSEHLKEIYEDSTLSVGEKLEKMVSTLTYSYNQLSSRIRFSIYKEQSAPAIKIILGNFVQEFNFNLQKFNKKDSFFNKDFGESAQEIRLNITTDRYTQKIENLKEIASLLKDIKEVPESKSAKERSHSISQEGTSQGYGNK